MNPSSSASAPGLASRRVISGDRGPGQGAEVVLRPRVFIADDHPLIIEGLRAALVRFGIEVVGEATTADTIVASHEACRPDVAVLDVRFGPGMTGLDVARDLLRIDPGARIVFHSQFDQDEMIREAYQIGGYSFVTKNMPLEMLVHSIHMAYAGKTHFAPEIAERLALMVVRGDESPRSKLDARELEVFSLMARGFTNAEISEQMSLSGKTISTTSQSIKDKLGVSRPADITLMAVRHRIIEITS